MYSLSNNPSTTSLSEEDNSLPMVQVSHAQWSSGNRINANSPMAGIPPEILIHILRHLHSAKDLYHTVLVSRTWCQCSVELLWHKPTISRLRTLVKMMGILARADQTFTYAHFIRRLNFLFIGPELTDCLFARLAQCNRLERLTLVNCGAVSDDALQRVLPCCPQLVAIDLTGVLDTGDKAIVALAVSARRLQGINLGGCKKVTDVGVCALASHCPLLRRVKLSGVESITDESVSLLAKSCPLLLEVDLNNCKLITDISVRDIWTYSSHMREMRLAHCILTDAAFPAPLKNRDTRKDDRPNPFPESSASSLSSNGNPSSLSPDELPPLILSRSFDHLRMLDLTACAQLTDDAIEGVIAHAPKIRTLTLSKCVLLTDRTVENICKLGKHIHYLHLGHAASITDRSVRTLARCCTRLRYIDLANCVHLTDMSVFELSSLPKLRRIGLVRVNNLTDEAIYSLAERDATLERIHLSYCDRVSVMAVHFLLQKLSKLTHLSLTGIPAFRKPELQKFCRPPPPEFNMSQRAAFCVYSGKGVAALRHFLSDLFESITEEINDDTDDDYALPSDPRHYRHIHGSRHHSSQPHRHSHHSHSHSHSHSHTRVIDVDREGERGHDGDVELDGMDVGEDEMELGDEDEDEDEDEGDASVEMDIDDQDHGRYLTTPVVHSLPVHQGHGMYRSGRSPNIPSSRSQVPFLQPPPQGHHHYQELSSASTSTQRGHGYSNGHGYPNGHSSNPPLASPPFTPHARGRPGFGFAQQVLVEPSHPPLHHHTSTSNTSAGVSPAPSDGVASSRSANSNGAGFFRAQQLASPNAPRNGSVNGEGILTPDLNYAEIGHGRGTGVAHANSSFSRLQPAVTRRDSSREFISFGRRQDHDLDPSYYHHVPTSEDDSGSRSRSSAEPNEATMGELAGAVRSALVGSNGVGNPLSAGMNGHGMVANGSITNGYVPSYVLADSNVEASRAGRSVRQSLKGAFHSAASSLLFGGRSGGSAAPSSHGHHHEGPNGRGMGGPSVDGGARKH